MTIDFILTDDPASEADIAVVFAGLDADALAKGAPLYEKTDFSLYAHLNGKKIGYLHGNVVWGWLYIELLWIEPSCQKSGLGSDMMRRAEAEAMARGLIGIHLFTQGWQAPEFYKKLGYEEYARFDDFPRGHQRICLRKYL